MEGIEKAIIHCVSAATTRDFHSSVDVSGVAVQVISYYKSEDNFYEVDLNIWC